LISRPVGRVTGALDCTPVAVKLLRHFPACHLLNWAAFPDVRFTHALVPRVVGGCALDTLRVPGVSPCLRVARWLAWPHPAGALPLRGPDLTSPTCCKGDPVNSAAKPGRGAPTSTWTPEQESAVLRFGTGDITGATTSTLTAWASSLAGGGGRCQG